MYEYKVVYLRGPSHMQAEKLNSLAREGWRLVTVYDVTAYLEREDWHARP